MCYERKIMIATLLCGILGCLCFSVGDWLMIYGDTTHIGSIFWLTVGAAAIAPWRNALAMALAFPGILFYGIALFATARFLKEERQQKIYHYLTAFSLTPWLCLHLILHHDFIRVCLDVWQRLCHSSPTGIKCIVCSFILARHHQ